MGMRASLLWVGGLVIASSAVAASAASSLSNSLTGIAGGISTNPSVQTALSAAGLQLDTVAAERAVIFDNSGATFGNQFAGDGGRNYLRTNDSDFSTVSFVAEITVALTINEQSAFIGMGAGNIALWGTPDWSTQASSASFWFESANAGFYRFQTQNDVNQFALTTVSGVYTGTHRVRMTFDASTRALLGEIDLNYAGGPFVADATTGNLPIDTTALFAADGWPSEPSRIFFGGDDDVRFSDLSITVIPEPTACSLVLAALLACGGAGVGRPRGIVR